MSEPTPEQVQRACDLLKKVTGDEFNWSVAMLFARQLAEQERVRKVAEEIVAHVHDSKAPTGRSLCEIETLAKSLLPAEPVDPLVEALKGVHSMPVPEGILWWDSLADRLRSTLAAQGKVIEIKEKV